MKHAHFSRYLCVLLAFIMVCSCLPVSAHAAGTPLVELDLIKDTNGNGTKTGIQTGTFKDTSGNTYHDALQFGVVYNKKDRENYQRMESIDYQLGQRYTTFSGTIACGAGSEKDVLLNVDISLDGQFIYQEQNITYKDIIPFEVSVEGGRVLRITCSTATDDYGYCIVSGNLGTTSSSVSKQMRLQQITCTFDGGQFDDSYVLQYSNDNNIQVITANQMNKENKQEIFEFDNQGRLHCTTTHESGSKTRVIRNYVSDASGKLVREYSEGSEHGSIGRLLDETTYFYDAQGHLTKKEVTTFDDEYKDSHTDKYTYEYDSNGRLASSVYRPWHDCTWSFRECTYTYGTLGNLTEETELYAEDVWSDASMTSLKIHEYASSRTFYIYDVHGQLSEKLKIGTGLVHNYSHTYYQYYDGLILEFHFYGDFDNFSLDKDYNIIAFKQGVDYDISKASSTIVLLNPDTNEPLHRIELGQATRILTTDGYASTIIGDGFTCKLTYEK